MRKLELSGLGNVDGRPCRNRSRQRRRCLLQLRDGGQVWLGRRLGNTSFRSVSLRQSEWNRADGHKQKQIKRASDKVRFDGGVSLFFHIGAPRFNPDFLEILIVIRPRVQIF